MINLEALAARSNIIIKTVSSLDVAIYEDHRYLLNVLFHAKLNGDFPSEGADIICFDRHDDAGDPFQFGSSYIRIQEIRRRFENYHHVHQRESWDFVEFETDAQDGNWVKVGMELGLINNIYLIGCTDNTVFYKLTNKHEDHTGKIHKAHFLGKLNEPIKKNFKTKMLESNFLILDFDLDCFSIENDKTSVIESPFFKTKTINFVKEIITIAQFVTIARESDFCGGYENSHKILSIIDRTFFNNELTTTGN